MKEEFQLLYAEFRKIKHHGWIKSMRKGTTGIGYTFETLLNKPEDNFSIPDFHGIELKTMKYFSMQKIRLFSAAPDGDTLFPIKRVVSILGYPDKQYPEFKVLNMELKATEYTHFGYKMAKIQVNWDKEKIDLIAYSIYGKSFKLETSWSFEMLEKFFCRKLSYLAVIKACSKIENSEEYFYYNKIDFYQRKDFITFVKLVENGTISVSIHVGIFKDDKKLGKIHDRGTGFSILYRDLPKLFDSVEFKKYNEII